MPLFDVTTRDFGAGLTAEADEAGGPGSIVNLPILSFAVYRQGEMPLGEYRVGLVCVTYPNTIKRFWDTTISVVADDDDPAGFRWEVSGAPTDASGSLEVPVPLIVAGGGAVLLAAAITRARFRDRTRTCSTQETSR